MSLSFRCAACFHSPSITPPKWKAGDRNSLLRFRSSPVTPQLRHSEDATGSPSTATSRRKIGHPPTTCRRTGPHVATPTRMFAKANRQLFNSLHAYTVDPTPLNPSRRTTTTTTKRKKTIGPPMPRPDTPAGQIAVSTPAWGGY